MENTKYLKAGDWVQVCSAEEIAKTLDESGALLGLPFMREMSEHCGKRFRVSRRALKTCIEGMGMRWFPNDDVVVLEELRCSGTAHDGCQKACLLFWKELWLNQVDDRLRERLPANNDASVSCEDSRSDPVPRNPGNGADGAMSDAAEGNGYELGGNRFIQATGRIRSAMWHEPDYQTSGGKSYCCQSTQLVKCTKPLRAARRLWLALKDWLIGNFGPFEIMKSFVIPFMNKISEHLMFGVLHPKACRQTPEESMNLQPGEWVEVKPFKEIAISLDAMGCNRGLPFTGYMIPYCKRRLRVKSRVERIILEATGKMREISNTVTLEGAVCESYNCFGGCPRYQNHFWREIWLRRVEPKENGNSE